MKKDFLIVGQGLAGSFLAWNLLDRGKFISVVDDNHKECSSLAAAGMGSQIIEKHFTYDRTAAGPDHKCSLEPRELEQLVQSIREINKAFGNGEKIPAQSEIEIAKVARKSLVAACDIQEGTILSEDKIAVKRPGTGMSPKHIDQIVGKKTKKNIAQDELISLEMVE